MGRPLERETRSIIEPRFGHDFSHVRVHTDSRAAESARAVGALAYTVANHIAFGIGRYPPENSEGWRLLAHELAHTIQQDAGATPLGAGLEVMAPYDPLEHQADLAASAVLAGGAIELTSGWRPKVGRQSGVSGQPAPVDLFAAALQEQPPNTEKAYLAFFPRSIDHMLRTLEGLNPALRDVWANNITPVHPGDDETSKARARAATEAVKLRLQLQQMTSKSITGPERFLYFDQLMHFERSMMNELMIIPTDQLIKLRQYLAKRVSKYYQQSPDLFVFIKGPVEGFCANLYDDNSPHCGHGSGNCTIGYGHKVHDKICDGENEKEEPFKNGIEKPAARQLFTNDMRSREPAVNKEVKVELNQCQVDALISFTFNTGGISELVKPLNEGDFVAMPNRIKTWPKKGTQGQDLTSRRLQEAQLFEFCKYK